MAQNGAYFCTGDEVIDETGAEALLLAVAGQAGKDLRRRRTPAIYKRTALEFLVHIGLSDEQIEELLTMAQDKTDSTQAEDDLLRKWEELSKRADSLLESAQTDVLRRQAAPPAPVTSPFEGMDAARLDAVGVSTQWANMTAEQYAELQRRQAHAARAAALGVLPEYLPQDTEVSE